MDVVPDGGNRESGIGKMSNGQSEVGDSGTVSAPRPPVPANLPTLIEAYRQRVRRDRRLRYLALASIGVGSVWLAAALLFYAGFDFFVLAIVCLGAAFILPTLALELEHRHRPSASEVAEMLDRRMDDRERLVTSVELLSRGQPLPEMSQAQLLNSTALLSSINAEELYPARTPWQTFSLGGGVLLVALGLFLLKGGLDQFTPLQVGGLPPDQKDLAALISPTPQSGLPESERTPPAASNSPSDMQGNNSNEQASQQAQEGLDRLTRALDEQSVTQQAADSLRQGDYGGAGQKLADVGQESDQLSDAAKEGLADSLSRAAQDSGSTPDLQQAEQQAADALRNGDYGSVAKSLKDLSDALQKTAGNVIPQQELAKRFPEQPGESQSGGSQSGQSQGQGQQSQNGQNGQGQQGENDQGNQGQEGQGQNGQNGQSNQGQQGNQGQGSGNSQDSAQSGNGNGGNAGGDGHNSRVMGPEDNTKLNTGNNPFELEGNPKPGETTPADKNNQPLGLTLEGDSGSGNAMAPSQGGPSNAQGESNNPPVARWRIIQRYFGGE